MTIALIIVWALVVLLFSELLLEAGRSFAMCLMFPEGLTWQVRAWWYGILTCYTGLVIYNPWVWA